MVLTIRFYCGHKKRCAAKSILAIPARARYHSGRETKGRHVMASDIENEKRSLRTAALAMRASLPPELRAEYSRAICRRLYEHPALSKAGITRSQPGVIHYDGDPVMTGAEIDVHLEEKGIKMVVNPFANKNDRKPNMIQSAFADFFNDFNAVRDDIHKDIQRQSKRVEAISKLVQKKLNL